MLLALLLGVALLLLVTSGPEPIGRIALHLGANRLAQVLLSDPAAHGVAAYRAGDFIAADADFAKAGRTSTYNRGLSLAATGAYDLSVAYFDAVLFANPGDGDARHNRQIVAVLTVPTIGEGDDRGRISAADGKVGADEAAESARLQLADQSSVRKPNEEGYVAADEAWLATLSDDPGEFLRLRLRAEYDRRTGEGLIRPAEAQPW
jgi:Ca-activated chloride channel family protein